MIISPCCVDHILQFQLANFHCMVHVLYIISSSYIDKLLSVKNEYYQEQRTYSVGWLFHLNFQGWIFIIDFLFDVLKSLPSFEWFVCSAKNGQYLFISGSTLSIQSRSLSITVMSSKSIEHLRTCGCVVQRRRYSMNYHASMTFRSYSGNWKKQCFRQNKYW